MSKGVKGINYEHDCDACVPLGVGYNKGEKEVYDLYFCPDNRYKFHTVLARYGNDGCEYRSFSVDTNTKALFERKPNYVLAVAYRKAIELGLFK